MKKKVRVKRARSGYGIAVIHPDGVVGFLTDPDGSASVYKTAAAASAAMEERKLDTRYTWTLPMEIRKYNEQEESDVIE